MAGMCDMKDKQESDITVAGGDKAESLDMEHDSSAEGGDDAIQKMLQRVAASDAHFKHQQRGEPDLSTAEKLDIAKDLLINKPDQFLSRFGLYLLEEDLANFDNKKGDYFIDFYLKEIRRTLDDKKNKTKVKNRRYEAVLRMVKDGDEYFTDEAMQDREPFLYHQMIGQYQTEEEAEEVVKKANLPFSSLLTQTIVNVSVSRRCQQEEEKEECQMEESDDDDEYEDEIKENPKDISSEEKMQFREEFLHIMQERFIHGNDKEFDYSTIDGNVEFDSLDIREHDEEEKYFDEEEPEYVEPEVAGIDNNS